MVCRLTPYSLARACELDAEFAYLVIRQDRFPADILVLAGSLGDGDPFPFELQNQRSLKLGDGGDTMELKLLEGVAFPCRAVADEFKFFLVEYDC